MSEVTLHPAPRWRDVVLEQIYIVGLSLRPVLFVVGVVLAVGTFAIVEEILREGPGFDSTGVFPTPLVSFLFPFAIWRHEKPFGTSFLWTFPVDRRQLALTKVFAGLVWLTALLAFFIAWLLTLGLLGGVPPELTIMRIPFIATIALYLFGSAAVLGLRYPLRWLFGLAGLFFLIGGVNQVIEARHGMDTLLGSNSLFLAVRGVHDAFRTLPGLAQWAITTVLSIGAGLAALFAAASRHRERRRR